MIDKVLAITTMVTLLIHSSLPAPTSVYTHNRNSSTTEDNLPTKDINFNSSVTTDLPTVLPMLQTTFNQSNAINNTNSNYEENQRKNRQLQVSPTSSKNNLKARKNNNDLYFCCADDTIETLSFPHRKNRDREKDTKSPNLKRKQSGESEEPYMERRPALLLRFFPDGTAVLISKFQLHLHVKPKQINFEPVSEEGLEDETIELNPSFILNEGKSYEVTYKRVEAIPSSREQNEFDLDESEERETYSKHLNLPQHESITTPMTSIADISGTMKNRKLLPIHENTSSPNIIELKSNVTPTVSNNENATNKIGKLLPIIGDSPFFMMTEEEMSSLQKQYEPGLASPLQATTPLSNSTRSSQQITQAAATTVPTTNLQQTTLITTPLTTTTKASSTTTTKCLSFKNQVSLALSTEDNIDNSLLKQQIFPTLDCNNSNSISNPFANLKKSVDTTTVTSSSLPIITRLLPEPTTTPSYTRNNIVPYLASHFSDHPTNPDVFVVTSLPMLIDLKSTRNHPVTNAPAWREVTVGVVRDQQGQPLMPRYNNWTAHLRGLRKKTENKFWNDFTTPKPNVRSYTREPLQQNIQQSPSQVHRAFWTDLQRQNPMSRKRNENRMEAHMYLTNPPKDYTFQNKNKFQFWRIRTPGADSGWNVNGNSNTDKYSYGNPYANFGNTENRQNAQWNQGNQHHSGRRW